MLLMRTSSLRIRRAPWTLSSRFIPFSLAKVSSKPFSASSKVCCYRRTNTHVDFYIRFPLANTTYAKKWYFKPKNILSYFVPLWFLHFLGLPLCGEDKTGSQGRYSPFSNSLLGVPYCIKDVIKERLHLLKEEGGCTHSQLPQHQYLKQTKTFLSILHSVNKWKPLKSSSE